MPKKIKRHIKSKSFEKKGITERQVMFCDNSDETCGCQHKRFCQVTYRNLCEKMPETCANQIYRTISFTITK